MTDDLVKRLRIAVNQFYGTYPCGLLGDAADRIEELEKALRKIAAVEDEHINMPKTNESANLWACLAMCVELAEKALEGKKDG